MEVILLLLIGTLVFTSAFCASYAIAGGTLNLKKRVRQVTAEETRVMFNWRDWLAALERFFKPLGELVPRSPEDVSRQQWRLIQAGYRRKDAAAVFYGVKVGVALSFLMLFGLSGYLYRSFFLCSLISLFLGLFLPDMWLRRRTEQRREAVLRGLPDLMDLTVVCVEAGLGLDQSVVRIGQELQKSHAELSDELRLFHLEVNAGKARADALRNLARRTNVDDLKSLVAVLMQTDRFGTSVAQSLRVFSDNLRVKRRQRAEEQAAKLAVKMLLPLMLFILPAIFVVTVGPAVISVMRGLLPMLQR